MQDQWIGSAPCPALLNNGWKNLAELESAGPLQNKQQDYQSNQLMKKLLNAGALLRTTQKI
jgi:hypothetical protein